MQLCLVLVTSWYSDFASESNMSLINPEEKEESDIDDNYVLSPIERHFSGHNISIASLENLKYLVGGNGVVASGFECCVCDFWQHILGCSYLAECARHTEFMDE